MQLSNDLRFPFRGNSSEALLKLPPRAAAVIKSKLCHRPSRSAALKGESGTPASRQERFPRFHQPHSAEKQWSRYCGSGPTTSTAKLRLPPRAAAPQTTDRCQQPRSTFLIRLHEEHGSCQLQARGTDTNYGVQVPVFAALKCEHCCGHQR